MTEHEFRKNKHLGGKHACELQDKIPFLDKIRMKEAYAQFQTKADFFIIAYYR
jgi:hypothetical protein